MQIDIDPDSGFCFGVVFAIQLAEEELKNGGKLYCIGDIVHNNMEVDRLKAKGMEIISQSDIKNLHDCKVLIRAHGEPPETYRLALENNIELIDASCPVVLKLQNRIRLGYSEMVKKNGQIVIYGKKGHAEVNGLVGQTSENAIIVNNENDLEKIDFSKPIYFYSQTTQSTGGYEKMVKDIKKLIDENGTENQIEFIANDTICRQVSHREPQMRDFAAKHDVVIFVSGKKSSNGIYLYEVCLSVNANTHMISAVSEISNDWFENVETIGICGATSTPMWLMEEVAEYIKSFY
ncbi:MAG: 4-hydroxy-3-methylbut-2-enyl diphosphate reductase [Bacteroidetes bacterium]|nr:4-hydroxy-3-methylbut-2-enyl diphosphate reductase [Bacteroidota bacterium]